MTATQIIFYSLAFLITVFSILAVTSRKLLRAAIFLLFVLVSVASIYVMLDLLFLAAVQVIVYAGGIVVLIIFSILLTSHLEEKLETPNLGKRILSLVGALVGGVITVLAINTHVFKIQASTNADYTVASIGKSLLSYEKYGYVLPFEVISILLLAAMVAAIIVAKRKKVDDDN